MEVDVDIDYLSLLDEQLIHDPFMWYGLPCNVGAKFPKFKFRDNMNAKFCLLRWRGERAKFHSDLKKKEIDSTF